METNKHFGPSRAVWITLFLPPSSPLGINPNLELWGTVSGSSPRSLASAAPSLTHSGGGVLSPPASSTRSLKKRAWEQPGSIDVGGQSSLLSPLQLAESHRVSVVSKAQVSPKSQWQHLHCTEMCATAGIWPARGLMNQLCNLLSRLFWCLVMWTRKVLLKNKILLLSHGSPLHEPLVSEVVVYTAKK